MTAKHPLRQKTRGRSDIHRYILRRRIIEREDGSIVADALVFTMGEHGTIHAEAVNVDWENSTPRESGIGIEQLVHDNSAEMKRAMDEGRKWESRMRESPLGKTQQDFVAYYSEVISIFAGWFADHGIPVPEA